MKIVEMTEEEVVIVGGGIAGVATALALCRVGVRPLVLEGSHELRTTGAALNLLPNAWLALDALGVAHKLTHLYAPIQRVTVTNVITGDTQEIISGEDINGINGTRSVHRKTLLEVLAAELPIGTIRFSSKLKSIEAHEGSSAITVLTLEDGTIINAKVVIGCDGVNSVVAKWLGLSAPTNSGRLAVRALSVFPQGHGLKHELHQFLGHGHRFGCAPLNERELHWFLVFTSTSPDKEEKMIKGDLQLIKETVLEYMVDFPEMLHDIIEKTDMPTLTCAPLKFRFPWELIFKDLSKGNITVAGDAMHPMTPDLAQGGCSALEDAVVLGRHIGNLHLQHGGRLVPEEVAIVLRSYVKARRWRAAGLIFGSYMSGRVQQGDSGWLTKFLRDTVFYKSLLRRIASGFVLYDCGKLPNVTSIGENSGEDTGKKFY